MVSQELPVKVSQLCHYIPALSQSFSKAGPLYDLSPLRSARACT